MLESGENDCNTVHITNQHIQSSSKENNQASANTHHKPATNICENTVHSGQETLQKSSKIESNDTNMMQNIYPENNRTSLNMIALAYNSDEEVDISENESAKTNNTKNYDNQSTIPIDQTHILQQYRTFVILSSNEDSDSENESTSSSDSKSSSDSSESSDSSDSDSDTITKNKKKNNQSKEGDKINTANKSKEIKNEFDELPPIKDLQISVSEDSCDLFGEVDKIVEQMVIVKPQPGKPTLNLETVLFLDKGQRVFGKIFDVFGSVNEPYYCVRFNNFEHIKQNKIETGLLVYYCPNTKYTLLVFLHELTKIKGCDAIGDDEPPEFSDDEEEQAYYRKLNQKNDSTNSTADNDLPRKRQRVNTAGLRHTLKHDWRLNHPWNRNAQSQRYEQSQRNSNRFNRKYNDWQQVYAYQSNMYWQSVPQHLTSNRLHPGDMSQYQEQPNFQIRNMYQYPRTHCSTPSRLLPPFFMNHSQSSNAPLSWNMVPYPYAQSPMSTYMNTPWPSPSVTSPLLSVSSPPPNPLPSSSSSPSSTVLSSSSLPVSSFSPSTKTATSNDCDTTRSN